MWAMALGFLLSHENSPSVYRWRVSVNDSFVASAKSARTVSTACAMARRARPVASLDVVVQAGRGDAEFVGDQADRSPVQADFQGGVGDVGL